MGFFKDDTSAEEMVFMPYKNLTATDTQTAIQQIVDTTIKVWSSLITYSINEACYHSGSFYKSKTNSNINKNPSTETSDWEVVSSGAVGGLVLTDENNFDTIDPLDNTALLLHFNGDNFSVVISDSSYNKTVFNMAYACNIYNTLSKFGNGSLRLDGSTGSYLTLSDHSDLDLRNTDFTIELWVMPTANLTSERMLFFKWASSSQYSYKIYFNEITSVNTLYFYYSTNGTSGTTATFSLPYYEIYKWYHIAIVRNGTSLTVYSNGVSCGSYNIGTATIYDSTSPLNIGSQGTSLFFHGYLDEIRYSNIARYTSNFTPSTNQFDNDSETKLLLHFDTTHKSTPIDSSTTGHAVTPNSASVWNTPTKFNGIGQFIPANYSYLQIPWSSDFNFLDKNFTIDFWINLKSLPASTKFYGLLSFRGSSSASLSYSLSIFNDGGTIKLQYLYSYTGSAINTINMTYSFNINEWYHISVIRNSTDLSIYINGTSQSTTDIGTNSFYSNSSYDLLIGCLGNTPASYFDGFMDEFRIVNGNAKWTSNFTPPTAEY